MKKLLDDADFNSQFIIESFKERATLDVVKDKPTGKCGAQERALSAGSSATSSAANEWTTSTSTSPRTDSK